MSAADASVEHLLVIDDNEAIHNDFRKIFTTSSAHDDLMALDAELFGEESEPTPPSPIYALSFASQGRLGCEIVQEAKQRGVHFGTAFVDMRMPPGWDGVQTIQRLWEIDPDLQVVICTAFSDHSWSEIARRLGRTDKLLVLKKPFDEIEAVQLATSLCEKRRLLDEHRRALSELTKTVVSQQSKLESAHQNAEVLIDSISSILVCLDRDHRVTRWNPHAENTFDIKADDAIGSTLGELPIAWSDAAKLESLLQADSSQNPQHDEIQFVDRCGEKRTLDIRISPLSDAASAAMLVVATDVTRQRFIQAQLDQSRRLESVGQLAAGVAHEINTPMQYIGDNVRYVAKTIDRLSQLLDCLPAFVDESVSDAELIELRKSLDGFDNAHKVRTAIEQMPDALVDSIDGVEAVSKIVAAMKELSHPGTGKRSQLCINHVLQSTIAVARNEWKYVAEIQTDLDDQLLPIDGLPSELNQAFLNIIINASHAIGDRTERHELDKGVIAIGTRDLGDAVQITISDNGGGIPAAIRKRVFEPFFTTKDVGKGTGQGLAIAHSVIVQKHHGKLWFDVDDGIGTTFTIQIPRCPQPAAVVESTGAMP
ncbi:ATP-binding protein [Stieleria sp. ICT_E10.1]|uniref:hybrid sensor histidine kinase/response regulator n=1 Tax=Stieleria sedimenti TaxID=2976331 RepID=UPI0021809572|nr:ATP-binding protein [Stieleria sedimenti]MCS7468474.1 ATP-binding protein [Stieleria sedimenti]